MNNPKFFFDKPHENAIIDLNNEILQEAHLLCATKELPISVKESEKYFNVGSDVLDNLVKKEDLFKNPKGDYIYPYDDSPSFSHSLDQLSEDYFKVMNNNHLMEVMERAQVYREAHEGAILINKGETYVVNNVNLNSGFVNVSKQAVDYHTMVLKDVDISIDNKISKERIGDLTINFGELIVSEDYYKYKKMHFSKVIGSYELDLPPLKFKTKGLWFTIPVEVKKYLEDKYSEDDVFAGGLHGVEHALIGLFPLHVMCDRFDIGGLSTNYHNDTQEATIFIYDAYEGGIGITEKAVEVFVDLLKSTKNLLENCDCKDGCPSCIYSPKCGNENKPLHKKATEYILSFMCNQITKETKSKNKKAISVKKDNIQTIKKDIDTLYEEAVSFYEEGNYTLSKDILVEIIGIDKKYANAWALIGKILYNQDDIDGAITFTKKALAIDSAHEDAYELLIELTNS